MCNEALSRCLMPVAEFYLGLQLLCTLVAGRCAVGDGCVEQEVVIIEWGHRGSLNDVSNWMLPFDGMAGVTRHGQCWSSSHPMPTDAWIGRHQMMPQHCLVAGWSSDQP